MALHVELEVTVIVGPHIGIGHSKLPRLQLRGFFVGCDVKLGVGEEEESLNEGI